MIIYRLKSKNVIYDLYLPKKDNGRGILYVPGLPGNPRKIFLGSSFGGGCILSSHIKKPLTFVLLAPVTKLQHIKDSLFILPNGDDDLFYLLSAGYTNAYRKLSKKDWHNFLNGKTLINPENNIHNLKNKNLIFVQGTADDVIQI